MEKYSLFKICLNFRYANTFLFLIYWCDQFQFNPCVDFSRIDIGCVNSFLLEWQNRQSLVNVANDELRVENDLKNIICSKCVQS